MELAKLRQGQGGERDDLALRQQQRFERAQALLRARQAGGDSSSPRCADEVQFTKPQDAPPALSEMPPEAPPETPREPRDGLSGVWDSHALPGGSGAAESGDSSDGRSESGVGSGVRPGDKRREDGEQKPPAPPEQPEDARRRPESEIDPEDVLASSLPGRQADNARARIEPEGEQPREKTGLFEKRDKRDSDGAARADEVLTPKSRERTGKDNVRGRIEEPEKKPHFLDPDYKGPSKEELDRARELEKAIRVHKAREARKRAAERRRLERDKDRDGPER